MLIKEDFTICKVGGKIKFGTEKILVLVENKMFM